MNILEQLKNMTELSFPENDKFLPFEGAFNEYSVIVCGRTDTAIRWAQKFLEAGFVTATEFKLDEIPEALKPYEFNLRYQPANSRYGDKLGYDLIVAIATGDPELDQITATIAHDNYIKLIMSETPSRYANIRFPKDKISIEEKPVDNNLTENKPVIKLGVFEDELNSRSTLSAIKELEENFPDFQFDLIKLKPYDSEKYNFNFGISHNSIEELVNKSFDRGYNALFKEDIDLIIVDAENAPNFYLPDIEFWPTLIERQPNVIVTLSPKEKQFNGILDWPDKQKVFCHHYVYEREIHSVLYDYNKDKKEQKFPELESFESFKEIDKIYEKNPNAVIITSFYDLLENNGKTFNLKDYNLELKALHLAPLPLHGFKIGISRKDNPSKALEMLKIASQKINQEQSQMFIFENFYRNQLDPYYGNYIDFYFSGGFYKTFDGKFTFDGFAEEKHGRYIQCGGQEFDSIDQAISEMFTFIRRALILW